ncbi:MAG TPA: A/G-specific adenine glycosylase [Prolixibacteraceae bacterium]|nr:A/G-specific adenine glycosylase [Prolixibacteraceae bacterium]
MKKKANTLLFSNKIQAWYINNKRDLPWRDNPVPYKIWLSEVILQQTRISQGLSYYHRFVDKYPTINSLANANEEEVLKLWQGLGYYSRARNMLEGAKQIIDKYDGKIPDNFNDLLKIKGIGEYTAAAIASIAYNVPIAAIDGNVNRVITRYFGISEATNSSKGQKIIKEKANNIINPNTPGTHNQAVMELGALICKPRNPDCQHCPLQTECFAFNKELTGSLPNKIRKNNKKERFIYYFVISNKQYIVLSKRTNNDIWKNMYDFPHIENQEHLTTEELAESKMWNALFRGEKINIEKISAEHIHVLSHQRIHAFFIHISYDKQKLLPPGSSLFKKKDAANLPTPKLIENYIYTNNVLTFEL